MLTSRLRDRTFFDFAGVRNSEEEEEEELEGEDPSSARRRDGSNAIGEQIKQVSSYSQLH